MSANSGTGFGTSVRRILRKGSSLRSWSDAATGASVLRTLQFPPRRGPASLAIPPFREDDLANFGRMAARVPGLSPSTPRLSPRSCRLAVTRVVLGFRRVRGWQGCDGRSVGYRWPWPKHFAEEGAGGGPADPRAF